MLNQTGSFGDLFLLPGASGANFLRALDQIVAGKPHSSSRIPGYLPHSSRFPATLDPASLLPPAFRAPHAINQRPNIPCSAAAKQGEPLGIQMSARKFPNEIVEARAAAGPGAVFLSDDSKDLSEDFIVAVDSTPSAPT